MHEVERFAGLRVGLTMGVVEPFAHLLDDISGQAVRKTLLGLVRVGEQARQVDALDVLHGEVVRRGFAPLEHLDDVRMVQARGQARLVEEHADLDRILDRDRAQLLDDE